MKAYASVIDAIRGFMEQHTGHEAGDPRKAGQVILKLVEIKLPLGITTGLKTLGVDPTELLRRSGLPLTLFSSEQIAVTTEQVFALWQTLGELTNDPAIGLKLADQVPVAKHHPASIAAHHARNFRDGTTRNGPLQAALLF